MLWDRPIWRGEGILNARRGDPVPPPSLSDYYGTGPGQIPMDLRVDAPTLWPSTNNIQRVPNDGGAGAVFGLSGPEATRPVPFNATYLMAVASGGTVRQATFEPGQPDVSGVHMMFPFRFGNLPISSFEFTSPAYISFQSTSLAASVVSGNIVTMGKAFSFSAANSPAHLIEIRWAGGSLSVILNGVILGTESVPQAPRQIETIGFHENRGFGRIVSVICDDGYTAAAPEPAVLLARQTLAEQYGVAL